MLIWYDIWLIYETNKCDKNLFFFALTGDIGDLLLDVFDGITHASRQRATLIQKTARRIRQKESFCVFSYNIKQLTYQMCSVANKDSSPL